MDPEVLEKTICINCNEFDTCIKTRVQPVFFCEEYDNHMDVKKNIIVGEEKNFTNNLKIDLHMNCDNKDLCVYKNVSPVKWFCEEYR